MKKVLLVIDMQNDYLWKQRDKKFTYDTEKLVSRINGIIDQYHDNGCDVVYIRHIIQNLWTNRKLFGYSIAGTQGAELYSGLKKVSDNCFDKKLPNAFSASAFKAFVKEKGYDTVTICGIDECGCVHATAMGAIKNGLKVQIISDGVETVFADKKDKLTDKLKKAGVSYI